MRTTIRRRALQQDCGGRLQEDGGLGGKRPRQRQEPVKYFSGA